MVNCDTVRKNLDVTIDSQLYFILGQQLLFLLLICYVLWQAIKQKIWGKLEGRQLKITMAILSTSFAACLLFFLDNWVEVIVYLTAFKENPFMEDTASMEAYVVCVWLVTFLLNNFYILIGYLWHIIIAESVGQEANKRLYYLLVGTDVLQIVLIVTKYVVMVWVGEEVSYLDESYSQIVFTTLAVAVLLYQTYQFVKHLKFMQLIYKRSRLFLKIGLMALGGVARVIYNVYYIVAVSEDTQDWMISLDSNCRRRSWQYGLFLLCSATLLFVCPIAGAHSLFNSPLATASQVQQRVSRDSALSRSSIDGSLLE